jgi:hypothetical protein
LVRPHSSLISIAREYRKPPNTFFFVIGRRLSLGSRLPSVPGVDDDSIPVFLAFFQQYIDPKDKKTCLCFKRLSYILLEVLGEFVPMEILEIRMENLPIAVAGRVHMRESHTPPVTCSFSPTFSPTFSPIFTTPPDLDSGTVSRRLRRSCSRRVSSSSKFCSG